MEGLNVRYARDKIASYLIHKAIEENVGGGISPPSLEYQVHQFYGHDGAIAKFKTEKRVVTTKHSRTPVRSGSGVGIVGISTRVASVTMAQMPNGLTEAIPVSTSRNCCGHPAFATSPQELRVQLYWTLDCRPPAFATSPHRDRNPMMLPPMRYRRS